MSFTAWLKTPGVDRCYIIEADYLRSGELHTLRRSTHPFRSAAADSPALTPYPDTILALPEFDREMTEVFVGTSRVAIGELELFLDDELLDLVNSAVFAGQQLRMYAGDTRWPLAQFGQILVGQIATLDAVTYDTARLTFKDRAALFNRLIQPNVIAAGPNTGKPVPLCFGQCFNVPAVLINPVTKQYQVHGGPVHAITAVRENGQPISYTADLATGTFTLALNAKGRVTADVEGAVIGGEYLTTADGLMEHLVTGVMGLASPIGAPLPTYTLGLFIDKDRTVASVLDEIAGSVGAAWFFNRLNQVVKTHFNGVLAPSDALTPDDIEDDTLLPVRRIVPAKSVTLGFRRNWTPQADGLAGVIRETQPVLATLYEQAESVVVVENAGITALYPDSADIVVSTLIANESDATNESTRRAQLASIPRSVFELSAFAAPFAMQLGQAISINYPQYFAGSQSALITRLTDLPAENSVRLEVWR
ncbi:MAG: hypothetical protein ACK4GU_15230 [Alishewanella aestuarii]